MKIKVCGITDKDQAQNIAFLGIDAIGCILAKESPRCITQKKAKEIFECLPPLFNKVVVMVNVSQREALEIADFTGANYIQLHGEESPEYCQKINFPSIKAIPISNKNDVDKADQYLAYVRYILFDTYDPVNRGGTGKTLNYDALAATQKHKKKLILSGGINLDNIAEIVNIADPSAIDVNSGFEISPGIKDLDKLKKLIEMVSK